MPVLENESKVSSPPSIFTELEDYLEEVYTSDADARKFLMNNFMHFAEIKDSEYTPEQMNAYNEFCVLYEQKINQFLAKRKEGLSDADFQEMCASALEGPNESEGGNKEFVELLLGSFNFDSFLEIMKDVSRRSWMWSEDTSSGPAEGK